MIKNTSDQHQYLAAPTYENLSTVASKGRVANHSFSHLDFIRDRYTHRQEKKYRQIKLQRLQKIGKWAFRSLVHQINSLSEVLKLKQNFQIVIIVVTGKPCSILVYLAIGQFCTHHYICLKVACRVQVAYLKE